MKLGNALFRERSNAAAYQSQTFNAPGTFNVAPYGKATVRVGGAGSPGNPPQGGNYAGDNPITGGNFAGNNPPVPGNISGSNPPQVFGNYDTYNYNNQNGAYNYSSTAWGPSPNPANSFSTFIAPFSYIAGNAVTNGSNPGNPTYNPATPGTANYNPTSGGNPYYNPTTPGNPSPPAVVAGVTFPGGAGSTAAPVVPQTVIGVAYTNAGVTITVPTGGYVNVTTAFGSPT